MSWETSHHAWSQKSYKFKSLLTVSLISMCFQIEEYFGSIIVPKGFPSIGLNHPIAPIITFRAVVKWMFFQLGSLKYIFPGGCRCSQSKSMATPKGSLHDEMQSMQTLLCATGRSIFSCSERKKFQNISSKIFGLWLSSLLSFTKPFDSTNQLELGMVVLLGRCCWLHMISWTRVLSVRSSFILCNAQLDAISLIGWFELWTAIYELSSPPLCHNPKADFDGSLPCMAPDLHMNSVMSISLMHKIVADCSMMVHSSRAAAGACTPSPVPQNSVFV